MGISVPTDVYPPFLRCLGRPQVVQPYPPHGRGLQPGAGHLPRHHLAWCSQRNKILSCDDDGGAGAGAGRAGAGAGADDDDDIRTNLR